MLMLESIFETLVNIKHERDVYLYFHCNLNTNFRDTRLRDAIEKLIIKEFLQNQFSFTNVIFREEFDCGTF